RSRIPPLPYTTLFRSCAVTAEAVRKARQEIRRLARENPGAPVIVTGCAAQTEPETFAAMAEVTRVIGNHEKMQPATWATMQAPEDRKSTRLNSSHVKI